MLHHFWFIRLLPIIWPLFWCQCFDTDRYKPKGQKYYPDQNWKKDLHRQKHTITRTGNLGKMEHSWSACLGSFAHSSPHIGKLQDGQQYSPVTGLRMKLVSIFYISRFFWTPEACEATGGGVMSWPYCCWLVWEHLVRIISNTNKLLFNHSLFCLSDSLFLSHFFSFSPVREVWYRD